MSGEKAMAAVETPQGEIEHLRKVLDEVQTNQAEHAAHLDRLEHRTDALRANSAADRLLTRKNAEQAGAYSENTGAVLADIMGRLETLEVKDIQRSADIATASKATDLLAQYRRMVGNLFRRVADAVDGG